jgi:hypothetical protein
MSSKKKSNESISPSLSLDLKNHTNSEIHSILIKNRPDICLVTHGKRFKAHKIVISKHSTKLKYLLQDAKVTCDRDLISKIHLRSSLHAVAYFLVHVYMPPFNIDEDNIEDVADISHELGCVSLALKCKDFIKYFIDRLAEGIDFEKSLKQNNECEVQLTDINLIKCINICEKLRFVRLYDILFKNLKKNFYKIYKNIERFNRLNANTMRALVFDTELCIESEFALFYAIFHWIQFDEPQRKCYIEEFFKAVCFELIDLPGLIELESTFSELFANYKILNDLHYHAIKYHSLKNGTNGNTKGPINRHNYNHDTLLKTVSSSTSLDTITPLEDLKLLAPETTAREERLKKFKVPIILITNSKSATMLGWYKSGFIKD